MKISVILMVLLLFTNVMLPAAETQLPAESEKTTVQQLSAETFLGYTLTDVYANLGIPASVKTVRGPEEWQDDVVFIFADGTELSVCANRVWQVKLSAKSVTMCKSLKPGMTLPPSSAENDLDTISQTPAETIFELKKTSYPVRISAHTDEAGIICDLYIYRADF